jgi:hypothetical protein
MKGSKLTRIVLLVVIAFTSYWVWYLITFSMSIAKPFEVNSPNLPTKVLVATQGSDYKDQLTKTLESEYLGKEVYLNVIDASNLKTAKHQEWNAIVIIHTIEMWKPPKFVADFVNGLPNNNRLIVHATSGDGGYSMEGTDAITGASVTDSIPNVSNKLIQQINEVLN